MPVHRASKRPTPLVRTFCRIGSVLAVALATTACGSSSDADGSARGEVRVAIVSDSEISPTVADLVDDDDRIDVVSRELHDGYRMEQLDGFADEALAGDVDVLVYSGGANDLSSGPLVMLDGMVERFGDYQASGRCIVAAVPIFRYEATTRADAELETAGTRVLEDEVAATGVAVVSYLDLSLDMLDAGEDFFADGQLGAMHPGEAAYPRIATAIADAAASCKTT